MIKTYGQTPKQIFKKSHPMAHSRPMKPERSESSLGLPMPTDTCIGIKWGDIVGIARHEKVFSDFSGQVNLTTSQDCVFGLKPSASVAFMAFIKFTQKNIEGEVMPLGTCIIHQDPISGWVNAYLNKGQKPKGLWPLSNGKDKVTVLKTCENSNVVWIGYESGKLTALDIEFEIKVSILRINMARQECVRLRILLSQVQFYYESVVYIIIY